MTVGLFLLYGQREFITLKVIQEIPHGGILERLKNLSREYLLCSRLCCSEGSKNSANDFKKTNLRL